MTDSSGTRRRSCVGASHLALIIILLSLTGVAVAGEARPDISIATNAVEITVTIDDALKAYPRLHADLLAEGQRQAATWRTDAVKERRRYPQSVIDGRAWTYTRVYTLRSVIAHRYISIRRDDDRYEGGAHPNSFTNTILWDLVSKRRVSIRPFFKETADNGPTMRTLARRIRAALAKQKKARGIEVADNPERDAPLRAVAPQLSRLGPVMLAPSNDTDKSSGLTFHFSPYVVGPYAEGSFTAFVPWTEFKALLSPQGAALFSGERPAQDADD